MLRSYLLIIFVFRLTSLCEAGVDFNHQVVPILKKHCVECHAGEKLKGGFSMNDKAALLHGSENGAVVDLKAVEKSLLLEVVTTQDTDSQMPPKGPRLEPAEVAVLKQWIADGVPWQDGFTFKKPSYEPPLKPRAVTLPAAVADRTNPVDRLMDAYFEAKKLPRPAPLTDGEFIRRASLDLVGLLPLPEETAAYVQDAAPDKQQKLIRKLLSRDVDYAEHWMTFWNDLLRNDYGGTGFITGGRKQVSKWLYEALVENKRFDAFTSELIAPASDASSGFIDGIRWRGEVSAGQTVEIQFAQSVGQSFLGINLKCASCHDSFVDRWKLDEAYGLAAIYADKPMEVHRCDKPVGRTAAASWLFPELGQVDAKAPKAERLKQLAKLMTHPENGRFTRTIVNRFWHRLMGHGIVHPVDSMQTEPWNADLLDFLAMDLQQNGYNLKHTIELIATSQLYRCGSEVMEKNEANFVFKAPRRKRLTAEQFLDSVWQITGAAPTKLDAPIQRGKLDPAMVQAKKLTAKWIWGETAAGGKIPAAGDRLFVRKTLVLPAAVKRGVALVTCDNDFRLYINGKQVAASDNWQAPTAIQLGGKLKLGVNEIVVRVKNAGAGANPAGFYFQADFTLTNGQQMQLNSDESWVSIADIPSGHENKLGPLPTGWTPVTLVNALPAWTADLTEKGLPILAEASLSDTRMVRAGLLKCDALMHSLGRPNREQIVSSRPTDFTTLEALDLSNGAALNEILQKGAATMVERKWESPQAMVQALYQLAFSRNPLPGEMAVAAELLGNSPTPAAIQDLLWAVVMLPEFQFVR